MNQAMTGGENTRLIVLISVVATIGGFLFGFDSGVINGTVDGLQQAFGSTKAGLGFEVASMLLGCAVGAFSAGRLADSLGRRNVLIISAVLFLLSAIGAGAATSSVVFVIARVIELTRFGAWLIAVRENEDAARALGVDAFKVKLGAMTISAAITAAAGCFYAQYFLFIDSGIAYGTRMSIEALLTPIIGGAGTVFGPLVGALVVKALGEAATTVAGDAPGLNLIVYGCVLVLVIAFAPRGLIGLVTGIQRRFARTRREVAHG